MILRRAGVYEPLFRHLPFTFISETFLKSIPIYLYIYIKKNMKTERATNVKY